MSVNLVKSVELLKTLRHQLLIALALLIVPVQMQAASDDATVSADIITVITLTNRSGMVFGDISTSNTPGTIVLNPDGSRQATGGVSFSSTAGSSPAAFDVAGEPNTTYSITLPITVILSESNGGNMVVNNFTSQPDGTGLTDTGGQQSLFVGATLNVGSNQLIGSYSGIMSVTIGYN
ncbi:MAG: DUF4402 domain-containing protein [Pseudomonadota bacterium]